MGCMGVMQGQEGCCDSQRLKTYRHSRILAVASEVDSAMDPIQEHIQAMTRRHFFGRTSLGVGDRRTGFADACVDCWATSRQPKRTGGLPGLPHFAPKAKRAIYLFMAGAPCQQDMFDYKPKMDELFDKDLPESVRQGQRLTTMTSGQKRFPIAPSKYKFQQYGEERDLGQRVAALHGQDGR